MRAISLKSRWSRQMKLCDYCDSFCDTGEYGSNHRDLCGYKRDYMGLCVLLCDTEHMFSMK